MIQNRRQREQTSGIHRLGNLNKPLIPLQRITHAKITLNKTSDILTITSIMEIRDILPVIKGKQSVANTIAIQTDASDNCINSGTCL